MKRHVVVSGIAFGLTALTLGSLLVGCSNTNVEETPGVSPEELQSSLSTAMKAAEDNLAAAKTELEALIAAGDDASAQQLTDAVNKLNAAIENAKKAANDTNAATKAELLTSIETAKLFAIDAAGTTLLAAKEELSAAIVAGDLANVDAMTVAVSNLQAAINAASETAANADTELKNELLAALDTMKKDVAEAVELQLTAAAENLNKTVADAQAASAEQLNAAVASLNNALDLAKAFASESDSVLKKEITEQINDVKAQTSDAIKVAVETAYAELEAKINAGDQASADALASAVQLVNDAIANAKKAAIDEVNVTINATKLEVVELFNTAIEAKAEEFQGLLNASNAANAEALKNTSNELKGLVDAAVKTGSDDLAAAVEALEAKMIEAVDQKLADLKAELSSNLDAEVADIQATLEAFNLSVDAAKTLFGDADAALKAELEELIASTKAEVLETAATNLANAKTELTELMNTNDVAIVEAMAAAKADLEAKIAAVNELYNAMNAAGATDEELAASSAALTANLEAVNAALTDSIAAVKAASIQISDWTDATDELVKDEGGLDQLYALYAKYEVKVNTYAGNDFAKVEALYHDAWVRMVRISNVSEIEGILATFDEEASKVRTIPDVIYDAILEVAPSVDEVSYPDDKPGLDHVAELIADAMASGNTYVIDMIYSYGDAGEDLVARYEAYLEQYNTLLRKSDGTIIKNKMDELVANPLVYSNTDAITMMRTLRSDFDGWISDAKNALENVEGFAETYDLFVEYEARYVALSAAHAEAERLNADVLDLMVKIEESGATIMNKEALEAIEFRVEMWKTVYFSAPYAEDVNSSNYEMLDHAKVEELQTLFAAKVEAFRIAAQKFADKVDAIGDINLLKWDEINEALTEYGVLVISRDLNDFNYLFDETSTPADYYDRLITLYTEYRNLKAEALDAFVSTNTPIADLVVDIYDRATLETALSWFDAYGVKDEAGAFVFDNGKYGSGYVLGTNMIVDADYYDYLVELKADYDILEAAKIAETADVMAKIDEIGTVTVLGADRVFTAMRAYNAWLNGANAPDGFLASQYAVDLADTTYVVENHQTLVDALDRLAYLKEQVNAIGQAIHLDLEAKDSYLDFANEDDRNAYQAQLDNIYALIDQFVADNGGSDEGMIIEENVLKLLTAQNAVNKFDAMMALEAKAESVLAGLGMLNVPAMDLDYMTGKVGYIKANALVTLDEYNDEAQIAAERDLALAKLDAVLTTATCYEQYVLALAADDTLDDDVKTKLANELAVSYEVTVNRMAETTVFDDVAQNIKFVESELESIYPLPVVEPTLE